MEKAHTFKYEEAMYTSTRRAHHEIDMHGTMSGVLVHPHKWMISTSKAIAYTVHVTRELVLQHAPREAERERERERENQSSEKLSL